MVEGVVSTPRLLKSPEVMKWLAGVEDSLLEQFEKQGSPRLGKGVPIACWLDIVVPSSTVIPNKDGDNVYTTIQETIQERERSSGILGFVRDDKQVVGHSVWVRTKKRLINEYATLYAWEMKEPYIYPLDLSFFFMNYYIPEIMQGKEYEKEAQSVKVLSNLWSDIGDML